MALLPSRTKYRKHQKGNLTGLTKGAQFVDFGDYGLQVLERGKITGRQIEACRVAINRTFSRKGRVWIRIFPDKSYTKKPAETRMGKGKGSPDHWGAAVKPGRILFEVAGVSAEDAKLALVKAAAKLPLRTRFVERVERV